jgi:hypothetical protein
MSMSTASFQIMPSYIERSLPQVLTSRDHARLELPTRSRERGVPGSELGNLRKAQTIGVLGPIVLPEEGGLNLTSMPGHTGHPDLRPMGARPDPTCGDGRKRNCKQRARLGDRVEGVRRPASSSPPPCTRHWMRPRKGSAERKKKSEPEPSTPFIRTISSGALMSSTETSGGSITICSEAKLSFALRPPRDLQ